MFEEPLRRRWAAVNYDGAAVALAHATDFLRELAAEDRRVLPFGRLDRRRHYVLGHAVELVGELPFPRWPGGGESLVGLAAEKKRFRFEGFVDLELVAFLAAIDLERPAGVLEFLASARGLEDSIERVELSCDDSPHGPLLDALVGVLLRGMSYVGSA